MKTFNLIISLCLIYQSGMAQSLLKGEETSEEARFFVYGTSTINTTDELVKSLTGSQKFAIGAIIRSLESDGETKNFWRTGIKVDLSVNAFSSRTLVTSRASRPLSA